MEYVFLIIGLVAGFIISLLFFATSRRKQRLQHANTLKEKEHEKNSELNRLSTNQEVLKDRCNRYQETNNLLNKEVEKERSSNSQLMMQITQLKTDYKNLNEKLDSRQAEMQELQKKFTTEFENIAHKILKRNTEEFSQTNQKNMGELLNPLKERITNFEKKVEDTYQKGIKDQTDLKAEIKSLHTLNQKISQEANNLTRALKGDVKKQGNWGEMILEKVLERSGLSKGAEYELQYTGTNQSGKLIKPDVVIHLPEDKHIIIDAKVSLVAYEQYINSDDQDERNSYLKQHLASVRNHIKTLSDKNYESSLSINSPDFVLIFLPVEPAFSVAIENDPTLFNVAWEKKIVLVSPTTLLATLKTVASIWRQEKQTQNALEIARQGGNLYDKFVSFLRDLEKLGSQLQTLQKTYDEAHKKLATGRGNLVRNVEKLKELGARTGREIPAAYKQTTLNDKEE